MPWDQATRIEARDFCRWAQVGTKPEVTHWRRAEGDPPAGRRLVIAGPRGPNPVTGKAGPGPEYAPATALHSESVLRGFYDFHLEAGTGPMVNPFPVVRRRQSRAGAHPKLASRQPRCIPDDIFNELFANLGSHRDRALVAFWVSTGARASELLGALGGDVDVGQQLVTVIRKGTRAMQQLPASPDAFVWLRLYQAELQGRVPIGHDAPLWWTSTRT